VSAHTGSRDVRENFFSFLYFSFCLFDFNCLSGLWGLVRHYYDTAAAAAAAAAATTSTTTSTTTTTTIRVPGVGTLWLLLSSLLFVLSRGRRSARGR